MLSRLVVSRLRALSVAAAATTAASHRRISPFRSSYLGPDSTKFLPPSRPFSTDPPRNGDDSGIWKLSPESDEGASSVFGDDEDTLSGITEDAISRDAFRGSELSATTPMRSADLSWSQPGQKGDFFENIEKEERASDKARTEFGADEWETAEGYKPWSFGGDDNEKEGVFDIAVDGGEGIEGIGDAGVVNQTEEKEGDEEQKRLDMREQELLTKLKGPNRAFGDLIAASGIAEDMIDSLILLKDASGVPGLPPLSVIEDKAIARMNATSTRGEIERKKQEEIQKARVRQVDEKDRAYGTGRRKCSIARVWIQPGDGKFIVNDKQFDAYFPILDHRAELLRPFTVTKTLGLWDVNCTVKGGGVSGQVGAIRLGISRALQNWEPGLRPYLKSAGYLTRDPRVVERKKPGKAKARKSFQWVKR